LHFMLLGVSFVVLGLQCVYMGILSQVFFDYSGGRTEVWFRRFPYSRTVAVSALTFAVGLVLGTNLVVYYVRQGFHVPLASAAGYLGVFGLMLALCGFITFTFVLLLHSTAVA